MTFDFNNEDICGSNSSLHRINLNSFIWYISTAFTTISTIVCTRTFHWFVLFARHYQNLLCKMSYCRLYQIFQYISRKTKPISVIMSIGFVLYNWN
jgi:hypothetical protein